MTAVPGKQAATLSVITATYNAAKHLPRLIQSLQAQTDQDFEWVVADGGSKDGTLDLLEATKGELTITIDSRPDFGIYDALNRAVKLAHGSYYLVVGADDELFPTAIESYKRDCSGFGTDFVTARVQTPTRIHGVYKHRWEWLNRMGAHVSGHAVGLAIRRNLHNRYGLYSAEFPIASDVQFVLTCVHAGATIHESDFVAGKYSTVGRSGAGKISRVLQDFIVLTRLGHSRSLQLLLMNYRLIKFFLRGYKP